MHYNTDIGEQGEHICNYLDNISLSFEEQMEELQGVEKEVESWLKKNGFTEEDCIDAGFEPIEGHQGRAMDFEYNGDIRKIDVDVIAKALAEEVIEDTFSVRVFTYDEESGDAYKNLFCVEVWFTD